MGFKEDLSKDITTALKAGDRARTSTLRLLLNAVKNKEIELRRDLEESEAHQIVATLIRQRKESIEQYEKGGRSDLAEKEEEEIKILKGFLPPQLSGAEVEEIVKKAALQIGASTMKDMGRLMKEVMGRVKGKADGRLVQEMVKKTLGG
ncbi:MAG: GatB/YqeY domain-containing protein [Thermodesulfobacteriota bacterium]|nr:MAG: GatB/YqeY domain-containing protein [Thermodesulfobacteriota bacterium]